MVENTDDIGQIISLMLGDKDAEHVKDNINSFKEYCAECAKIKGEFNSSEYPRLMSFIIAHFFAINRTIKTYAKEHDQENEIIRTIFGRLGVYRKGPRGVDYYLRPFLEWLFHFHEDGAKGFLSAMRIKYPKNVPDYEDVEVAVPRLFTSKSEIRRFIEKRTNNDQSSDVPVGSAKPRFSNRKWQRLLKSHGRFEGVKVSILSEDSLAIVGLAKQEPVAKQAIHLNQEFCFRLVSPMNGYVAALQKCKGQYYSLPLSDTNSILEIGEGENIVPVDAAHREPLPLSEPHDIGLHEFVFLIVGSIAEVKILKDMAEQREIHADELQSLAITLGDYTNNQWAIRRINIKFEPGP